MDWNNPDIFVSAISSVENVPNVGINGTFEEGPIDAAVTFSDGFDTRVFNYIQALVTYNFNDNNNLNFFYGGNISRTGLAATVFNGKTVAKSGSYYINSQLFGGWYSYTTGNLNLIPEAQLIYAKADKHVAIPKYTSNFAAVLFANYSFGKSPYSLETMTQYFNSIGKSNWYIAPRAEGVSFEVTPTWQYKDLFARVSLVYVHLTNEGAYGNDGNGRDAFQSALEAGIIF